MVIDQAMCPFPKRVRLAVRLRSIIWGWRGGGACSVRRILRLALLAPDIIEAILAGRAVGSPMLEQLERPLPASWAEQRGHFGR
jgi:hypothetical protein